MSNTPKYVNNYKYPESDLDKPWGWWKTTGVGFLPEELGGYAYCDKKICVNPEVQLSLQKHYYREECWEIIKGEVTVYVGESSDTLVRYELKAGDKIHIPCGHWHFLENSGHTEAVFTERQLGVLLDEKDIKRKNDKRGFDEKALESHKNLVLELGLGMHWPRKPAMKIYPTNAPEWCFPAIKGSASEPAPDGAERRIRSIPAGQYALAVLLIGYLV